MDEHLAIFLAPVITAVITLLGLAAVWLRQEIVARGQQIKAESQRVQIKEKLDDLHLQINSRWDQVLEAAKDAATAAERARAAAEKLAGDKP